MKLNGFVGKGTGKLGASVFAISGGEQIVRQYNPRVSNPSTDAQAEQRAKLKLMSQIAADMAQSIAFQKKGLVSARNQFISANIGKCRYSKGNASVDYKTLDLTGGSGEMPLPTQGANNAINLASAAPVDVTSVVYAAYTRGTDGQLSLIDQQVGIAAGEGRLFPTQMTITAAEYVIFCYGIKGGSKAGEVNYGDYAINAGGTMAALAWVRQMILSGGSLTKTSAADFD